MCVYGIPAESGAPGESDLVAAVAPFENCEVDIGSVKEVCEKELERNSMPSYFQIVAEIPKTISEKPLERILKESFRPDADNVVKV